MRGFGADEVVDYEQQDFSRLGPFDHVLDLVAHRSVFAYRRGTFALDGVAEALTHVGQGHSLSKVVVVPR